MPSQVANESRDARCLYVIWSNGRHCEEQILRDIAERFEILQVFEVIWSAKHAVDNFQRFYADIDIRGIYHGFSKGKGPFIAVTVVDPEPVYEERTTSRGPRFINGRFLDAKKLYREWAGEYPVHCTENTWENNRDMYMLFGMDMEQHRAAITGPWNGTITQVERDLTGADGWESEEQLFATLNRTVDYVVATGPAATVLKASGEDINILARDGRALHTVLSPFPPEPCPIGGKYRIKVAGISIPVGLRHPDDGFFPTDFANRLLGSRELVEDGSFRPAKRPGFVALAYHYLVHQPRTSESQRRCLVLMAADLGKSGWTPDAVSESASARKLLEEELTDCGVEVVMPKDAAVYFNSRIAGKGSYLLTILLPLFRQTVVWSVQKLACGARTFYWQGRDQLLLALPSVRAIKRWVTG